jgi:hypothetical protein
MVRDLGTAEAKDTVELDIEFISRTNLKASSLGAMTVWTIANRSRAQWIDDRR